MNDEIDGSQDGMKANAAPCAPAARFRHVTGKTPRSIAIVACGPTSQTWHAANFTYERQCGKPDEVWALNKGLRTIRADVGFVMDDMVGEARRAPQYAEDLRALSIPIITSIVDAEVRSLFPLLELHEYPIGKVWSHVGLRILLNRSIGSTSFAPNGIDVLRAGNEAGSYIHNSVPYILAYALMIGVKQIGLFGADYTFPGQSAREDDRANAEYWVGMLRMAGVDVQVPDNTTLLNKAAKRTLYGYGARLPMVSPPTSDEINAELAAL